MRRRHAFVLAAVSLLLVSLLGMAPLEGPTTLRYNPESGLAVHYSGAVRGAIVISAMGQEKRSEFALAERHTDRVVSVTETERTLERTRESIEITAEGKSQKAPTEVLSRKESFVLNELGEILRVVSTGQATPKGQGGGIGGLDPTDLAILPIVLVPFPEQPVSPGDSWDTGKALLVKDAEMPLDVAATTTLISVYESEGMQVALTQTDFTATGKLDATAPPGTGVVIPPGKVTFAGALLQSVRIEDGCLLGTKATFTGGVSLELPGGPSMSIEMTDVTWQMEVAGE